MTAPIYPFYRGEPITIGRRVISGDPAGLTLQAVLKPTQGQTVPGSYVPVIANFTTSFVAKAGAVAAHWLITIPAEVSAALPAGQYFVAARFMQGSDVVKILDPAFITLRAAGA